ncbi:hypothetical protein RDI58_024044 [Solanum bulbocastanum]|uniref:Uncharacterized protein n=1 Tax=Solanum bulbocastanum TaxID=147425 RepID=A0AAN8Y335_SOLBU
MICFEVLTGRVAFEDSQEKMWRNMRTGPTKVVSDKLWSQLKGFAITTSLSTVTSRLGYYEAVPPSEILF